MAKFFISNSSDFYHQLKTQILPSNFKLSFDYDNAGVYALAVHKLEVDNKNACRVKENFCITTGTCIYDESLDYEKLLSDYQGNVADIRQNSIGQYAIAIRKGGIITIFGDPCGCYDIYFYQDKTKSYWMVSNSLYDMVKVIDPRNIQLDEFSIIERTVNRCLLNGETFFSEIKRLRGTECLHIQNDVVSIQNIQVDFIINKNTQEALALVTDAIKENARIVAKALGTPTICATGGLDSRLLLASFLSVGVKPILLYGVGNSNVTSPRKEDELCVEKLGKRFNLKVIKGDFSVSNPIDKDWDSLIPKYGFPTAYMWGAQRNVIESLKLGTNIKLFGWGGELLRNITGWNEKVEDNNYTISEFLQKWYMARAERTAPIVRNVISNYDSIIASHMAELCKYHNIPSYKITPDNSFLLELTYRSIADTQIPSFVHQFNYCWLLPFEYNVLRYRVNHRQKDEAEFMLKIINSLCPEIFEVPIFSHQQHMILDRTSMRLIPAQTNYEKLYDSRILSFLRGISPKVLKQMIFRPLKRIIKARSTPKSAPLMSSPPVESINHSSYQLNISNSSCSEDVAIYAILTRIVKSLGY